MGAGASVPIDGELAKVLSASDNDLAAAADKLNRDIKRMVPKTASGRLDAASIEEDERDRYTRFWAGRGASPSTATLCRGGTTERPWTAARRRGTPTSSS